ncbi:hypothetical protein J6590_042589 [Homalodisca vitripennis]|nr:hypothetical protein J6590_042589 [Homalodisca vitripennis]
MAVGQRELLVYHVWWSWCGFQYSKVFGLVVPFNLKLKVLMKDWSPPLPNEAYSFTFGSELYCPIFVPGSRSSSCCCINVTIDEYALSAHRITHLWRRVRCSLWESAECHSSNTGIISVQGMIFVAHRQKLDMVDTAKRRS